jgi:hypothetical protein
VPLDVTSANLVSMRIVWTPAFAGVTFIAAREEDNPGCDTVLIGF